MTAPRRVPFFNYPYLYESDAEGLVATLTDVMTRGAYIMQKDLEEFESDLAEFLEVKHAFGVADGTNAITLSLVAAGVAPGDEVLMPSHTFVATAGAAHMAGAQPVLVDCGRDHLIDITAADELVSERTRAIMPVHVNGRTCDMEAVRAFAERHGLIIVEDAAQALGSTFDGRGAGTFGSAGTFSFYPAKVLGCFGDGGGIVTNDDSVAEQLYELRDHGRGRDGEIKRWGFNSRLDNMQAAVLSHKLKSFPQDIRRRREIAALYRDLLGDLDQVQLPPAPDADPRHFDVYQNYELEADERDALRVHLSQRGVGTLIQWNGEPLHRIKALGLGPAPAYTEAMFDRCLMLPCNTSLTDEDVTYVAAAVRSFYAERD